MLDELCDYSTLEEELKRNSSIETVQIEKIVKKSNLMENMFMSGKPDPKYQIVFKDGYNHIYSCRLVVYEISEIMLVTECSSKKTFKKINSFVIKFSDIGVTLNDL